MVGLLLFVAYSVAATGSGLSDVHFGRLVPISLLPAMVAGLVIFPFRRIPMWLALLLGPVLGIAIALAFVFLVEFANT